MLEFSLIAFFHHSNQEFIAADTANQIIGTTKSQNVTHRFQGIIADLMTVQVIDELEIIQIDVKKADLRSMAIFYSFIEITPVIQTGQNIRIGTQHQTLLECPLCRHIPANTQFADKTVKYIDNGFFRYFDNSRDTFILQANLDFACLIHFRILQNGFFPFFEVHADHINRFYFKIFLEFSIDVSDSSLVVIHQNGKRHAPEDDFQFNRHIAQIGHVMRDTDCPHQFTIFVKQRRLVSLELAHSLLAFDPFIKHTGFTGLQNHFLGFQTDIFTTGILIRFNIPDIVMSTPFYIPSGFSDRIAKGIVDLEMRTTNVLEPDEIRNTVHSRMQISMGQISIFFQPDLFKYLLKMK